MARPKTPEADRFWSHVNKTDTCWLWTGKLSTPGYGTFRCDDGKRMQTHRWAWEQHNGNPVPDDGPGYHGWCVLHTCDVRHCVRPDHLFLGSHAENMKDRDLKGKVPSGDNHWTRRMPEKIAEINRRQDRRRRASVMRSGEGTPNAKLTWEQVDVIRARLIDGELYKTLAADYGVSCSTISLIARGKKWIRKGQLPPTQVRQKRERMLIPLPDRIANSVEHVGDCWVWKLYKQPNGYGLITVDGYRKLAHRVSWAVANEREIPKTMLIMHTCDNRACVNPAHLKLGTYAENARDRDAKGRHRVLSGKDHPWTWNIPPRGSEVSGAKLDEEKVKRIRAAKAAGQMQKDIAIEYGVSQGVISEIVNRKAWIHI